MASIKTRTSTCSDCGKNVEIFNGDFEFSMELHKQSHKPIDYVNKTVDRTENQSTEKMDNSNKLDFSYCQDCKENFKIINNDLRLSFMLHAQRHKSDNMDALSDHSSASSSKSKSSGKRMKDKDKTRPVVTNILDAIFNTMPPGLKAHQSFIAEQNGSKAVCNLCKITIEPIFRINDHLKTKLHEDNTIALIKSTLSSESHDQMEFISFYGSNLCCNLCRCKVDLCAENVYKTVVNIFTHNSSKAHLSKKTASVDGGQADETLTILKNIALMNPTINDNQHLIDHKLYPHFKCRPCNKVLAYSDNLKETADNFNCHFNSPGHIKYVSSVALLTKWSTLNITGKEKHDFVFVDQKIVCLSCNSEVEANLDGLLFHTRRNTALYGVRQPEVTMPGIQGMGLPYVQTSDLFSFKEEHLKKEEESMNNPFEDQSAQLPDSSSKFKRLVQSLPIEFRNIITQNTKGEVVCSVCECVVPSTSNNVITHLKGSNHVKKQSEIKSSKKGMNYPVGAQAKDTPGYFDFLKNLFESNHLLKAHKEYLVRSSGENSYTCVLCNTLIQGDRDSFLHQRIITHIESPSHISKVQLKEEMLRLMPRHRDILVRELFDCLPLSFQRHLSFIKAPEGENFVFCVVCCVKISKHRNCLLEHVDGGYHVTAVERFQNSEYRSQMKPVEGDAQYQEIVNRNQAIKRNSKYLGKENDDYICKPCKAVIKNSYDSSLLESNLLSHITGKKHKKFLENEFGKILDEMQVSSLVVKKNRKFLEKKNDNVWCTLCSCKMPLADNVGKLKYNLEIHLSGSSHMKKLEPQVVNSSAPPSETTPSRVQREMAAVAHRTLFCDILGYDEDDYVPLRF